MTRSLSCAMRTHAPSRFLRLVLLLPLLMAHQLESAAPGWWSSYQVLDGSTQGGVDDFAAVNVGQLKTMMAKSKVYLDMTLPGGAGSQIDGLIASWKAAPASGAQRDDFAVVTLGQLKTMASMVYARMRAEGRTVVTPWTAATTDDDDFQLVNVGQVKTAFAFTVQDMDTDSDGYMDSAEIANGWDPRADSRPTYLGGNGEANSTPGGDAVYYSTPSLIGETKGARRFRGGDRGYQTTSNHYKVRKREWDLWRQPPEQPIKGSHTWTYDAASNAVTESGDSLPDFSIYAFNDWTIESDTLRKRDDINNPNKVDGAGDSKLKDTLSDLYTRENVVTEVNGSIPAFSNDFRPNGWSNPYPIAKYNKQWLDNGQNDYTTDDYEVSKCQYKWRVQAGDPRKVVWYQGFKPESGPEEYTFMSWTPGTGVTESGIYTIDPLADPRNGHYFIQRFSGDLDALTLRSGTTGYELDEQRENSLGAFVPLNNDDDDYDANNQSDKDQTVGTPRFPGVRYGEFWLGGTDTDLLPIVLRGAGAAMPDGGIYTLNISPNLRVWRNPDRTVEVSTSTQFVAKQNETRLYVEGVQVGEGYVALDFVYGSNFQPNVDSIKVTVFSWSGPLNVPGYSKHQYTCTGAPGNWITPTGGQLTSGVRTQDVEVLWSGGPVVGLMKYYVNRDYTWALEVNVVSFQGDFNGSANKITCYPQRMRQHPQDKTVIESAPAGSFAMEASLVVTQVRGPIVNGQERVAAKFELGWVQCARGTQIQGRFDKGFGSQLVMVSNLQDQVWYIDMDNNSPVEPWYFNGNTQFLSVPRGGWKSNSPHTFSIDDRPTGRGCDSLSIFSQPISSISVIYDFELVLAVRTTESVNSANLRYTSLAKGNWRFDGSGTMNSSQVWRSTGSGTTSSNPKFIQVISGQNARCISGTHFNQKLNSQVWSPRL